MSLALAEQDWGRPDPEPEVAPDCARPDSGGRAADLAAAWPVRRRVVAHHHQLHGDRMTRADLIAHLYKRRDQRPRGSAGWHDLDRAVLLLNRAWSGVKATEAEIRHAVGLVTHHAPELAEDMRAGMAA